MPYVEALRLRCSQGAADRSPPIGAPGAMPQTPTIATHATYSGPWMKPATSSGDLLYAFDSGVLWVFSYPEGTPQGQIDLAAGGTGNLCSDNNGNVFVPPCNPQPEILEYAHGGTQPLATLSGEESITTLGQSAKTARGE